MLVLMNGNVEFSEKVRKSNEQMSLLSHVKQGVLFFKKILFHKKFLSITSYLASYPVYIVQFGVLNIKMLIQVLALAKSIKVKI